MDLVMRICDYLYVLDFGSLIFEGSPADALEAETVRAAYLGRGAGEPTVKEQAAELGS